MDKLNKMKRIIALTFVASILIILFLVYGAVSPSMFTQHAPILELPLYFIVFVSLLIWIIKSQDIKILYLRIILSVLASSAMYIFMSLFLTSCYFPKPLLNQHKTFIKFENNETKAIFQNDEHPVQWCF
jgi:hypothetical protein